MTTSTVTGTTAHREPRAGRYTRLGEQVQRLRTRAGAGELDRWMLIIGGILMPLGALLIILGWVGASRTPLPFEQNDYLISGGLLGLGLLIAGGFVYFGYWQTIRIRESRQQARQLTDGLARLEALLGGGATAAAVRPSPSGTAARGQADGAFLATPSGSIFHRPDCPVVAGRSDLNRVDPAHTRLEPCRICTPLEAVR
jgi:hypothetical protein